MARWICGCVLTYVLGAHVLGGEYEMTRQSIDGGGGMRSSGGSFEFSGTIGQPDAGVMIGGRFALTGGFWFALAPSDCNEDGVVGLLDSDIFYECLDGPGSGVTSGCDCFDANQSGSVDLADFAFIQRAFTSD